MHLSNLPSGIPEAASAEGDEVFPRLQFAVSPLPPKRPLQVVGRLGLTVVAAKPKIRTARGCEVGVVEINTPVNLSNSGLKHLHLFLY